MDVDTIYGDDKMSNPFQIADAAAALPESEPPSNSAANYESVSGAKRHSACNECRKRKLKCSGEPTGCARCLKQILICHYSKQAQMGRPRKRKSEDNDAKPTESSPSQPALKSASLTRVPDQTIDILERASFDTLYAASYGQYVQDYTPAPLPSFMTDGSLHELSAPSIPTYSDATPPSESPPTPPSIPYGLASYPTDVSMWPDYSTMTSLPAMVQDNYEALNSTSNSLDQPHAQSTDYIPSYHSLPSTPACPCLPNLYLTLSTLSSLSTFPISVHTIESLQNAHRTAHSVLYCSTCPTKFQSGMQNVMMSGTLLTVLGDNWHRVLHAPTSELRTGFSPPRAKADPSLPALTPLQDLEWRTFAWQLIRANVFGDMSHPSPPNPFPSSSSRSLPDASTEACQRLINISKISTPTLSDLISSMERRQKTWHDQMPNSGEFPMHLCSSKRHGHMQGMTVAEIREIERDQDGHLCIKIAAGAKLVCKNLDQREPVME